MDKTWLTWIGKDGGRLDVLLSRRGAPSADMETVEIIRVISPRFRFASGVHPGSPVVVLRRAYPRARSSRSYRSSSGRVTVWDDVRAGLAWETAHGRIVGLAVHPAGVPLDSSFIPHLQSPLPRHRGT